MDINTPLLFHVTEKLSVCGLTGIPPEKEFASHGFSAHLQCTKGFDEWLKKYAEIKSLPFKDCEIIPIQILEEALYWLGSHWDRNHRILISCAAGESRSVSIAIGLLVVKNQISFMDACKKAFSKMPFAYPHPTTLTSVAKYCGYCLDIDQLKKIYDIIPVAPPFPWTEDELSQAVSLPAE